MDGVPGKFDVVVVGAGPAGSAAAYLLAKAGFKVLILERGRGAGSKELFGGKVYAPPLRDVWPGLDKEAPIHRWVTRERISFVRGSRVATIEYSLGRRVGFTTYLPELAKWMSDKAVEAGAVLVDEVRVDEIVVRDGRIVGVRSGPDTVEADVVVDAEGVNRLLLERLGLVERLNPSYVALGVKEVLNVGKGTIEERFALPKGEGLAWMVAGDVTAGIPGGGFIYTMKDTIAIGLVLHIGKAMEKAEAGQINKHVSRILEEFRLHPYFKQFWKDADVMEYGAHMTIEGGLRMVPKRLYAPGLVIVGDAAGLLLNTGYTVRGVDFAVASGRIAAEAIIEAFNRGGPTEENLRLYEERLKESFVWRELVRHRGIARVMEDEFYFTSMPGVLIRILEKLYEADYEEPTLIDALLESLAEEDISLTKLIMKLGSVVSKL
ncbi:MAG: FAD-dependent oxidoreductase [Desulfurococcales archaeon]|nr:FAD-dependent oxidoreductase [Desulfurococcales archaeon]